MISIHYIAQGKLIETQESVESLIKAINNCHGIITQCIVVCSAPVDVCQYLLDSKIISRCKGMKGMTYIQPSPEYSKLELIEQTIQIEKKLKTYADVTHNIIIERTDKIKPFQINNLIKEIVKYRPAGDPVSYFLFKDKKGGDLK